MKIFIQWKNIFYALTATVLVVLFQNCSGGDGTTVDNPLRVDQLTKVGFQSYIESNVEATLCINKVMIDVIEFYEDVPFNEDIINVVGRIRDVQSFDIGELRMIRNNSNQFVIFSWFPVGEYRTVNLMENTERIVYELELPHGRYESPRFIILNNGCPSISDHSIIVENENGEFYSDVEFDISERTEFTVNGNSSSQQLLQTQDLINDLTAIANNLQLDNLLENNGY